MIDEGSSIDAIYLNFAKAFDSVPHEWLLKKVEALGIESDTLQWIRDFLVGRHQRVSMNGSVSDRVAVKSGIPQGSVLGLILFGAFINDLLGAISSMCAMYADMTQKSMVLSTIVKTEISYRRALMHWSIGQILDSFVSTMKNVKYFTWKTINNVATK